MSRVVSKDEKIENLIFLVHELSEEVYTAGRDPSKYCCYCYYLIEEDMSIDHSSAVIGRTKGTIDGVYMCKECS